MITWKDRVRQKMQDKGWSLNQLAIKSNYSQSSLSRAMAGDGDLRANRLREVADALGTTCDWLLHGVDENEAKGRIPMFRQIDDLLWWKSGDISHLPADWVSMPGTNLLSMPFAWRMSLDDLSPEIRPGDLLLMTCQCDADSGSTVLYKVDGRPVCRILRKSATGDHLCRLDGQSDAIAVDSTSELLGVCVGLWRNCGIM